MLRWPRVLQRFGVFASVFVLPCVVGASPRVLTPEATYVGIDARQKQRVLELVADHGREFGWTANGMQMGASYIESASDPAIGVWRIEGVVAGVPLHRPIAHVLVDEREGGRVRMITWSGAIAPLAFPRPALDAAQALAALAASAFPGARGGDRAELVVVPGANNSYLAWRIDPPADLEALTNPVFLVDAVTGRVVTAHERLRFADVRSFSPNPLSNPVAGVHALNEIDDLASFLDGPRLRARNCVAPMSGSGQCVPTQIAAPDLDGNFVYDAPDLNDPGSEGIAGEPFSEAAGYFHGDRLFAWLDGLGFAGMPCEQQGEPAVITVNYASWAGNELQPFENAFYTGACEPGTVYMGQGEHDAAWDGDVVYHEFGHGVIDRQTNGGLGEDRRRPEGVNDDAGGINEGFSDFVAAVFTGDPFVFEYGFPNFARDGDNEYYCPRDLLGEVHADGELFAGAMWETYLELGEPFFVAVMDGMLMLDVDASFEESTASSLMLTELVLGVAAHDTAEAILDARGMVDCARAVDITEFGAGGAHPPLPERSMLLWPNEYINTYQPSRPAPVQFRVEFPDNMDTVDIRYDVLLAFDDAPTTDVFLGVAVRNDEPVEYAYEQMGLGWFIVSAETDSFIPDAQIGSLQLTGAPGDVRYLSFNHVGGPAQGNFSNPAVSISNLEVEFSGPPVPEDTGGEETETGTPDTESGGTETSGEDPGVNADDGGCGCRTESRPSGWWALALLGGLRRRRERA